LVELNRQPIVGEAVRGRARRDSQKLRSHCATFASNLAEVLLLVTSQLASKL
jgi:hypothetical protein